MIPTLQKLTRGLREFSFAVTLTGSFLSLLPQPAAAQTGNTGFPYASTVDYVKACFEASGLGSEPERRESGNGCEIASPNPGEPALYIPILGIILKDPKPAEDYEDACDSAGLKAQKNCQAGFDASLVDVPSPKEICERWNCTLDYVENKTGACTIDKPSPHPDQSCSVCWRWTKDFTWRCRPIPEVYDAMMARERPDPLTIEPWATRVLSMQDPITGTINSDSSSE